MNNNKLCIVDTVNFSIYNFADSREDAELKLQKSIEANTFPLNLNNRKQNFL